MMQPRQVQTLPVQPLLVDVRTPSEFEAVHIEGSVLHPLTQGLKPEELQAMAAGRDLLLVCATGQRACHAADQLKAAGLTGVGVLDGGVKAWNAAGLPVRRGRGVISLDRQVRIAIGLLVLAGTALAYFVHPAWLFLLAMIGAGQIFAGLADWCGMATLLARLPWNTRASR